MAWKWMVMNIVFCITMAQQEEGVTFTVNKGLKFKPVGPTTDDFKEYLYQYSPIVKQSHGSIIITTTPAKPVLPQQYRNNGFVSAILEAYNHHRNLILSPDDVWLAITTALSLYVNAHAEEMRYHFVKHEGQLTLSVEGIGTLYKADYNDLIDRMNNLINEKTKNDTRDWIVPKFSTTTKEIAIAGKVVMMAVLQKYFTYTISLTCGLSEVTLRGSLDDWQKLKTKIGKLGEFGKPELKHWAGILDFVIQNFIDSYNGNVDNKFWNRIVATEKVFSGPSYTAGWINAFMPFSDTGVYYLNGVDTDTAYWGQIDTDKVPSAVVECPVTINDNGMVHKTTFIAGHMAVEYDAVTNSVSPSIQWAIIDLPTDIESLRTEQERDFHLFHDPDEWAKWKYARQDMGKLRCFSCFGVTAYDPDECLNPIAGQTEISKCRKDERCEKRVYQSYRYDTIVARGCSANCAYENTAEFRVYCCDNANNCNGALPVAKTSLTALFLCCVATYFIH